MERKVIQLAGKTLVVSLPSKWARKYGIRKGDTLHVEEKEKSLLVRTSKSVDIEKAQLSLKGPYEFMKRSIDVAYKKGVDELRVSFESPGAKKIVGGVLSSTMGFEIVSQGEKSCTIKSIARAVEEEFGNILRRVFLTLLSMADESYEAVSNSRFGRLKEIESYDNTINKLTNFCKRVLNKKGYKDEKLTNYVYCIVWEIERIGDEYKGICISLEGLKNRKIGRDTLSLFRDTNSFLRDFYSFFYKFEQDKGISLTKKRDILLKKATSAMKKEKGEAVMLLHHLANIINSVYDTAGPYYAMVL